MASRGTIKYDPDVGVSDINVCKEFSDAIGSESLSE